MWAGRSGLPDSSLASTTSTHRAWCPPLRCTASSAASAAKPAIAVVGAAPPVEPIALPAPACKASSPSGQPSIWRLLVEVAVEQDGVVAVLAWLAATSATITGVRPVELGGPRRSGPSMAAPPARPARARRRRRCGRGRPSAGSNIGETAGMAM